MLAVKVCNMDDDNQGYKLSQKGLIMMLKVLLKAEGLGLFTPGCINNANIKDYIQTLADHNEIWEETPIPEREQRLVLLAMILFPMVDIYTTTDNKKLQLN